jgi:hypothetical protein
LNLFNITYSQVLFAFKIVMLLIGTECGFATIRLISQENFLLGGTFAVLFVDGVVVGVGIFQIAYGVTEGGEKLKGAIRGRAGARLMGVGPIGSVG